MSEHDGDPGRSAVRTSGPTQPPGSVLICSGLTATYRGRTTPTIRGVTFEVPPRGLVVVVGPSGSGKSTLCAAVLGEIENVSGRVELDGIDLLASTAVTRRLVSFVPQRDALHLELTPRRALRFVADLRLGASYGPGERAARVEEVIDLLEMTSSASRRIGQLSGGQRKRVAVAMELLSEPRLLMLDEPNSGLDEGLDRLLMLLLRRVADRGPTVLVVSHSTANLHLADTVLALDADGHVAYSGPPSELLATLGVDTYAEVMNQLRSTGPFPPDRDDVPAPQGAQPSQIPRRRALRVPADEPGTLLATRVLLRREVSRILAHPFTLARGVLLLPLLTCVLTAWAADRGLAGSPADPNRMQGAAMSVLITCTTFFAMALSFSTIVGDREVIEREHRWGVSPVGVVMSKALAWLGPALLQTLVTWTTYSLVRPGPDVVLAGVPAWPVLAASLALLGVASTALGLLVSSASRTLDRAVFLLMGTIAVLVVLTGLLIPLGNPKGVGGHVLATVAQLAPSRWGAAAVAAFIGYVPNEALEPIPGQRTLVDDLWTHDGGHVLVAWGSLVVLALTYTLLAAQLLVRQARRRR